MVFLPSTIKTSPVIPIFYVFFIPGFGSCWDLSEERQNIIFGNVKSNAAELTKAMAMQVNGKTIQT
jgi:hypothetical protein